jgi:hypothetical protein
MFPPIGRQPRTGKHGMGLATDMSADGEKVNPLTANGFPETN